jgi:hypothetical protein
MVAVIIDQPMSGHYDDHHPVQSMGGEIGAAPYVATA